MGRRQEMQDAFLEADLTTLSDQHQLARVLEVKGNSQIKCMCTGGVEVMAFLPARFRNVLWLRRGAIVIISQQDAQSFAIEQVLAAEQVKQLSKTGKLPVDLLPSWQQSVTSESEAESSSYTEEEGEEE